MALVITKQHSKPSTEQHRGNMSFDERFQMNVLELLGYNLTNDSLERVLTVGGKIVVLTQNAYEYMGSKDVGSYSYYGFKQQGAVNWKIMRQDNTDDSAWAYAYSSDGGNSWSTAWGAPEEESYGEPSDA